MWLPWRHSPRHDPTRAGSKKQRAASLKIDEYLRASSREERKRRRGPDFLLFGSGSAVEYFLDRLLAAGGESTGLESKDASGGGGGEVSTNAASEAVLSLISRGSEMGGCQTYAEILRSEKLVAEVVGEMCELRQHSTGREGGGRGGQVKGSDVVDLLADAYLLKATLRSENAQPPPSIRCSRQPDDIPGLQHTLTSCPPTAIESIRVPVFNSLGIPYMVFYHLQPNESAFYPKTWSFFEIWLNWQCIVLELDKLNDRDPLTNETNLSTALSILRTQRAIMRTVFIIFLCPRGITSLDQILFPDQYIKSFFPDLHHDNQHTTRDGTPAERISSFLERVLDLFIPLDPSPPLVYHHIILDKPSDWEDLTRAMLDAMFIPPAMLLS